MSSAPENSAGFAFSLDTVRRLGRLVRKELVEILRDRRTILTLVLMPVLLYPLLTVTFQQFLLASRVDGTHAPEYRFGFYDEVDKDWFFVIVTEAQKKLEGKRKHNKKPPALRYEVTPDVEKLVREDKVDVGVRLVHKKAAKEPEDILVDAEVIYLPGSPAAQGTLNFLERLLTARNMRLLESRLFVPEIEDKIVVMRLRPKALDEPAASGMISLAALVPLILILMTITGAVYPAIDLTAGERERGTLEILVAAPVPRLGLLFAKYVTVLTVAVLTALANLLTMWVTLKLSGMSHMLFGEEGWPMLLVAQMFGLLLLFAAFFSAVLLSLTSFARSFKEAQAYLIPLMLASLGPGLMGMLPGMKLEGILTVTPLINIVLMARDLFQGGADAVHGFLVVVSTLLYALAALALAAKVFGAEGVLYNEQSSWSDLWRRPRVPQEQASVAAALGCLGLMIPCNFVLQAVAREIGLTAEVMIASIAVGSVILFAVLPGIGAFLERLQPSTGFGLQKFTLLGTAGGFCLGLSLWPFVIQLMTHLPLPSLENEQIEAMLVNLNRWPNARAAALAVAAIAEEFFFRGYLFGALERTNKPVVTILLTAILFALMHSLLGGGLGAGQLLPAMLLGVILGTIRWHTGSVYPGMVLHVGHNVMLTLMGSHAKEWGESVPALWLVAGAVGAILGSYLLAKQRKGA